MIAHLLSSVPYVATPPAPVELPERPPAQDYQRPPRERYRQVPDHASGVLGPRR